MKKYTFSTLFVLISIFFLFASVNKSNASPLLQEDNKYYFTGVLLWNDGSTEINGVIDFELSFQESIPWFSHLDKVQWDFSLETFDGLLFIAGAFGNEEAMMPSPPGQDPSDPTTLRWGEGSWDLWCLGSSISDNLSQVDWSWGSILNSESPAWNLITNENFIPLSFQFGLYDSVTDTEGWIRLDLTPVPEPGTIFLFGTGLVVMVCGTRNRKNKKGSVV